MYEIDRGRLRVKAVVVDIDLAREYCDETIDVTDYESAWCLVRVDGVASAARFLDVSSDDSLALSAVRDQFAQDSPPPSGDRPDPVTGTLSVVICTRDRREGLLSTLESLTKQTDPEFDVLIVDNSTSGELAQESFGLDGLKVRCVHEPIPGLSRARNRALSEARSDYLAWIDDDEVADPEWIAWIKRGFGSAHRPAAVAGVMLPAELETSAQVNFERYGGFNKGRGMQPQVLRAGDPSVKDPFYPLPIFGSGGNMACRTDVLREIGGFDNRLGAGTLTCGGEDTLALSMILETGRTVLHWPPAVTWHYHRRTDAALERQIFGNSAGLTAYYMSLLSSSPGYVFRIAGFVPPGVRRILAQRKSNVPGALPDDFPDELLHASRRGLMQGGWLFLRERAKQRRQVNAARVSALGPSS